MDIFKFIDSCYTRAQLPYIRLVTVYLKDGVITNTCICRYNDKNIAKKAAKLGLTEDRMMTTHGAGIKIKNYGKNDLQHGSYYLNYNTSSKDITIFRS